MSETPYTVQVDRDRLFVRLTLHGLWDLGTVERYSEAAREAFAALGTNGEPVSGSRILIDLRQHGIQPRDVAERIQAKLKNGLSPGARHAVLVSESTLHRMQAQRIGTLINASFFSDEAEAMAWLFAGEEA